jgi:hypothetical protein
VDALPDAVHKNRPAATAAHIEAYRRKGMEPTVWASRLPDRK